MVNIWKNFDFGQNLHKISIFFSKISILVKFSKNFDFGQNFRKTSIFLKISKILNFFENYEKIRFG